MRITLLLFTVSAALAFSADSETLVRATVAPGVRINKLPPGAMLEAKVDRGVYAGEREVVPAGSVVRLVLDNVRKEKRPGSKLALFGALALGGSLPRPTYNVTLRSARLVSPDGRERSVPVEVVSILPHRRLQGKTQAMTATAPKVKSGPAMMLRIGGLQGAAAVTAPVLPAGSEIAAGTKARVMLVRGLRASQTKASAPIEARLLEPVRLANGSIVPAGSTFAGIVTAAQAPRRVFRPGSLRISFNNLQTADGRSFPIATVLTTAEVEKGAGSSLDREGGLSGGPATKARLLVDIGIAYGTGKLIDDLFEEGVKAGASAAVSGSTATTARYIGLGAGAVFMLLQKGNDVNLPAYTELELTFARPLTVH